MSATEAAAAVRSAEVLLGDAQAREGKAAKARADAEATLAKATEKHAAALAKSATAPDEDKLADAVGREATRVTHAQRAHDDAKRAHETVRRELDDAHARVEAAKRTLERTQLEEDLTGGAFDAEVAAAATDAVSTLRAFGSALGRIRAALAADRAKVERLRALGGTMSVRDGVTPAAYAARALLDAGATTAPGDENALRWLLQLPMYENEPVPVGAAAALFEKAFSGDSAFGRQLLERAASMAGARTAVEFHDAERARERPMPAHLQAVR
jgi:hypothetical protein